MNMCSLISVYQYACIEQYKYKVILYSVKDEQNCICMCMYHRYKVSMVCICM